MSGDKGFPKESADRIQQSVRMIRLRRLRIEVDRLLDDIADVEEQQKLLREAIAVFERRYLS